MDFIDVRRAYFHARARRDVYVQLPKEDENVRRLQDPVMPSKEQVDVHYIKGHIPFRSWCHICVEAFGKELDHRGDEGNPRKLPEYSWDYCCLFFGYAGVGPLYCDIVILT